MPKTALAERGKEKITAEKAVELVKQHVERRFKEDKAAVHRARAQAQSLAGGQVERVDKDVVDQGRAWATRLALISRATAQGSGNGYYQPSRSNAALVPIVKKLFVLIGELEAVLATDAEMSLFQRVEQRDYYGYAGPKGLSVAALTERAAPGETIDHFAIVDMLTEDVGKAVQADVAALLDQYEIEDLVGPAPDEGKPAKAGRRRHA